ncbi:Uncharacterised protein [Mycobacterium tuberculosis]|nr:Uncharacterised protein [Mycobacterium tuberculosis]
MVALEHIDYDLEIGQRLRQRLPHVAERGVDLIGSRCRVGQNASHRRIGLRGLSGQRVEVGGPAGDLVAGIDLAIDDRRRTLDDVVDVLEAAPDIVGDCLGGFDEAIQ